MCSGYDAIAAEESKRRGKRVWMRGNSCMSTPCGSSCLRTDPNCYHFGQGSRREPLGSPRGFGHNAYEDVSRHCDFVSGGKERVSIACLKLSSSARVASQKRYATRHPLGDFHTDAHTGATQSTSRIAPGHTRNCRLRIQDVVLEMLEMRASRFLSWLCSFASDKDTERLGNRGGSATRASWPRSLRLCVHPASCSMRPTSMV